MRNLTDTLAAAQTKHVSEPVAQVVIDDRHCGVFRPRWQRLVDDSVADGPVVVCMTYDGALLRARTDPAAGALYMQRITDPADTAQWTAWTLLESGIAPGSQLALAWDGNTIHALFYVGSDWRTISVRQSSDNGQTWSGAATVTTLAAGHTCAGLAATLNAGSGTLSCIYADEANGLTTLYSTQRAEAGGAWSAAQAWGRQPAAQASGLAVHGAGDTLFVAAGVDHGLAVYAVPVDSLAAWPAPYVALHSDSATISYGWPSIAYNFDQNGVIFFCESNTSTGSVCLQHVIAPSLDAASMFARPYQLDTIYGACAVGDRTYHYLCTSHSVDRARRWAPDAGQRVDVSADVHALRLSERVDGRGRLALFLRNDDGRYASAGQTGTYEAIRQGSQVSVRLGYHTAAGDEVSMFRPFWITDLSWQRRPGSSVLAIGATDGWGILDRTPARQAYLWTDRTVLALLTLLLGGLGFAVTTDGNATWSRTVSRFAINPGVVLGSAARCLLRLAGGRLIFRSDAVHEEHWPSAVAHLAVANTEAAYAYGGEHTILQAQHAAGEQEVTHVTALGEGDIAGEALDWAAIELANEERLRLVVDRRLITTALAQERAAEELAAWQQAAAAGHIVVAPNVGQEVLDAVTIDDAAAGLDDALRLVAGNTIVLDRRQGIFEQTIDLSEV